MPIRVTAIARHLKDPANMEVSQRYVELTESIATWGSDWITHAQCAAQDKYEKRFDEISNKLEKGLEDLGLGE